MMRTTCPCPHKWYERRLSRRAQPKSRENGATAWTPSNQVTCRGYGRLCCTVASAEGVRVCRGTRRQPNRVRAAVQPLMPRRATPGQRHRSNQSRRVGVQVPSIAARLGAPSLAECVKSVLERQWKADSKQWGLKTCAAVMRSAPTVESARGEQISGGCHTGAGWGRAWAGAGEPAGSEPRTLQGSRDQGTRPATLWRRQGGGSSRTTGTIPSSRPSITAAATAARHTYCAAVAGTPASVAGTCCRRGMHRKVTAMDHQPCRVAISRLEEICPHSVGAQGGTAPTHTAATITLVLPLLSAQSRWQSRLTDRRRERASGPTALRTVAAAATAARQQPPPAYDAHARSARNCSISLFRVLPPRLSYPRYNGVAAGGTDSEGQRRSQRSPPVPSVTGTRVRLPRPLPLCLSLLVVMDANTARRGSGGPLRVRHDAARSARYSVLRQHGSMAGGVVTGDPRAYEPLPPPPPAPVGNLTVDAVAIIGSSGSSTYPPRSALSSPP